MHPSEFKQRAEQFASAELAAAYAPMVGDTFDKQGRHCKVTMMSPSHVVCVIDGLEYTMKRGDFIHLAQKALLHGATLSRIS